MTTAVQHQRFYEDFDIHQSLYQAWHKNVIARPHDPAIELGGTDAKWTYAEAKALIDRYARAYQRLGLKPGDTIAVSGSGTPVAAFFAFFAANRIGVTVANMPIELLISPDRFLAKSRAKLLFVLDDIYPVAEKAILNSHVEKIVIYSASDYVSRVDDWQSDARQHKLTNSNYKNIRAQAAKKDMLMSTREFEFLGGGTEPIVEHFVPDSTAVILYTGGSTGVPKGVERTNEAALNMTNLLIMPEVNMGDLRRMRDGVFIPQNHPTGWVHAIVIPAILGTTLVFQPFYERTAFPWDLFHLRIEYVVAAPSHWFMLFSDNIPGGPLPDGSLYFLKLAYSGGEKVFLEQAEDLETQRIRLGIQLPIIFSYGNSETGPLVAHSPIGEFRFKHRAAKILPKMEGRIRLDNGSLGGPGEIGLFEVNVEKAGTGMLRYFLNPELTASVMTSDGYYKTGDLAVYDEEGYWDFLDRESDFYTDKYGEKRYLFLIETEAFHTRLFTEIEASKKSIPGIPGEFPVLHVIMNKEAAKDPEDTLQKLVRHLHENLPMAMWPDSSRFWQLFPTSRFSGKRHYIAISEVTTGFNTVSDTGEYFSIDYQDDGPPIITQVPRVTVHEK